MRQSVLTFAALNAVAAVVHGLGHLAIPGPSLGAAGRAYLALALASQSVLLAVAVTLPALGLAWMRPLRGLAAPVAVVAGAALHAFLWADRIVFAILGTHVNGALLAVAFAPGGVASLEMQWGERIRIVSVLLALLVISTLAFAASAWWARRAQRGPALAPRALAAAAVGLFTCERVVYTAGVAGGWREPVRAAAALPLHDLEQALHVRLAPERLHYPRAPLRFQPVEAPPNVLWIVVESWRSDALSPGTMPVVWRWSRNATRFLDHRSGGNWTSAGVFSMFYGLHAAYTQEVEEARRGPVVFDRVRELGYDIRVVASRGTRFPRFAATVFAGLPPGAVEDDLPGEDSAMKDRALLGRAVSFLERHDPARPFFLALFLDATHLPYAFAPEAVRFRPFTERLHYTEMTAPMPREPIYNRYLNAVSDVDITVGGILEALAASGVEDRTVVILTGDHGQEFYEYGALGHNIALNRPQTAVPLLMKTPGVPPGDVHGRTRHVDIVPTLMERLGILNPPSDYTLGRALSGATGASHTVMCGWIDCAVLDPDGFTTVFRPREPHRPPRVYDPDWKEAPARGASPDLPKVRRELRVFLE